MAQSTPQINISRTPVQSVQLTSLLQIRDTQLAALSQNSRLASTIVVISNQSDQAIVAVSALWRIRDGTGREQRSRQRCDVFLPAAAGKVVVGPKARLYLGPNTCIAEQSPVADLSDTITSLERPMIARLEGAVAIDIVLDAIMFQNGDMFASDSSYASEIKDRVTAAREVASYVQAELVKGRSRQQVVTSLSSAGLENLGQRGAWFRDFARALSRQSGPAFESYLASMGRLNQPNVIVQSY